jgi:hypothetical protein
MRRLGGTVASGAVAVLVVLASGAPPAGAELTVNEVGCAGSAVITPDDGGAPVTVDAEDDTVVLPAGAGDATYEGSVETVTHDHSGKIAVAVGPASIEIGSWSSPNEGGEPSASGTKELPSALEQVPPGKYEVTGHHEGTEGRCEGRLTVEVGGSILSTPASAVSLGLGVLGLLVLALGLIGGKPVLGVLGGLLTGLFGGLDLVFLKVLASDSILLVVLPILLLLVGGVLAVLRSRTLSTA